MSGWVRRTLHPGDLARDTAEWALTPARGLMIVSHDNKSTREAQTIAVTVS